MNKKSLFKLINEQASRDLPDVLAKIDLDAINIIPEARPVRKPRLSLQSVLAYSLSAIIVVIGGFWGASLIGNDPETNYTPLETEAEILGFQTLSSVSLLESLELTALAYTPVSLSYDASASVIETEIDTINAYINMLEIILGNQDNLTYELSPSDDGAYQTMIRFQGVDMTGEPLAYSFYYNATDGETRRYIDGKIIFLDYDYTVEGQIVTIGEVAEKSVFRVLIDEDNYIETRNLSSADRQRFSYRIYQNGIMTNDTELRLVASENALRASISYAVGNRQMMLQVEKTQAQNGFRVNYQIVDGESETGDIDIDVEYDEDTDSFSYRYTVRSSMADEAREYRGPRKEKAPSGGDDDSDDPGSDDSDGPGSDDPGNDDAPGNDSPGRGNTIPQIKGANI